MKVTHNANGSINLREVFYGQRHPKTITLYPGRSVEHHEYTPTEEGWWSGEEVYSYDGKHLTLSAYSHAVDCDGRLQTHDEYIWTRKGWHRTFSHQRDHHAAAMGY